MFVYVIGMRAKEGCDDALADALAAVSRASRTEPGCLGFDVYRGVDEPREFTLVERYLDAAGLDAHRETPHFAQAVAVLPGLVEDRVNRVMAEVAPE